MAGVPMTVDFGAGVVVHEDGGDNKAAFVTEGGATIADVHSLVNSGVAAFVGPKLGVELSPDMNNFRIGADCGVKFTTPGRAFLSLFVPTRFVVGDLNPSLEIGGGAQVEFKSHKSPVSIFIRGQAGGIFDLKEDGKGASAAVMAGVNIWNLK